MALKFNDRVSETSQTAGTGTIDLDGAKSGFQGFVAGIGDANTCFYVISNDSNWEVGLGTVTDAATDTLSRDTILGSSNAGSAVDWASGGTQDVSCVAPALAVAGFNMSKGPTAPANPQAGMLWLEDDNPNSTRWTQRQHDGAGWIKLGELDSTLNQYSAFGAWTLIESITAANDATMEFSSNIDGTYDAFMLVLENILAQTDATTLRLRVSESAAIKSGATDYEWSHAELNSSAAGWGNNGNSQGDSDIKLTRHNSNVAAEAISGNILFWTPAKAVNHLLRAEMINLDATATPNLRYTLTAGVYNGSQNAIDGMELRMSGGNIVSGTGYFYGLSKG